MVWSISKWLVVYIMSYIGFSQSFYMGRNDATPAPRNTRLHPMHVSTTEINHNGKDKTLEITCRLFIDDFESCLSKVYHVKTDLSSASMKTRMDSLVKKYLLDHLQIKADGKIASQQYLGFEKEDDVANAFFEVENVASVKRIDINNSILHDFYDDQANIIHVVVGGNRKSTKLDYPSKQAFFEF